MREIRQAFQQRTSTRLVPGCASPARIDELPEAPRRYADCGGRALFRQKNRNASAAALSASRDSPCSSWSPDSPAADAARHIKAHPRGILLTGHGHWPSARRAAFRSSRP
jgi:hypothetical protein